MRMCPKCGLVVTSYFSQSRCTVCDVETEPFDATKEIDHEYTDELVCPYCGYKHEDDGEMNEGGDLECYQCEKKFKYEVDYSKSFTSRKVACLNGGNHLWKKEAYPNYPDYKRCRACGSRDAGTHVVPVVEKSPLRE